MKIDHCFTSVSYLFLVYLFIYITHHICLSPNSGTNREWGKKWKHTALKVGARLQLLTHGVCRRNLVGRANYRSLWCWGKLWENKNQTQVGVSWKARMTNETEWCKINRGIRTETRHNTESGRGHVDTQVLLQANSLPDAPHAGDRSLWPPVLGFLAQSSQNLALLGCHGNRYAAQATGLGSEEGLLHGQGNALLLHRVGCLG